MKVDPPDLLPSSLLEKLLFKWSSINSYSLNREGLDKQFEELQQAFASLEAKMQAKPLKPYLPPFSSSCDDPVALGKVLLLQKRQEAPKQIFLCGHYDTVHSPSSNFQQAKYLTKKSCIQGPGVLDMKGGLLVLLNTLQAIEKTKWKNSIGWTLLISPDEEIGSPSSYRLIQRLAKHAHMGIVAEPCLKNGNLISARKGSLNFLIESCGREAHAGRELHRGENAISLLLPHLEWIENYSRQTPSLAVNIGYIAGGHALNTVPGSARVGVNVRSSNESALANFQQRLKRRLKPQADSLLYRQLSYRSPKPFTPETEHLFHLYQQASQQAGLDIFWEESGGVCDGNHLQAAGIPTIDTVGVCGGYAHSDREYMEVESLQSKSEALFFFFYKLATMPLSAWFSS